jgi:hypothetical protein
MIKFVIAFVIVAGLLYGGLMTLWRSRGQSMGSPEVLERARRRNEELEAEERSEGKD